ncbi:MAG: DUF547 domain-containing protein [Robiginitomaculum sp.]|nr:MAG: DUF547 domain-containing protein [Robiginitomaculum sp.]
MNKHIYIPVWILLLSCCALTATAQEPIHAPPAPERLSVPSSSTGTHHTQDVGSRASSVSQEPAPQVPTNTDEATLILTNPANQWANILAQYGHMGTDGIRRFDYEKLKASQADMDSLAIFIMNQASKKPSRMPRDQAMAYWANLYNALTIEVVVRNYPVDSIRQIKSGFRKGPWKRKLITVEGQALTLDDIEHGIMRPQFNTPLVHYMLNCASISCPNLSAHPWRAATLEADLDTAAHAYINSPRGVSIEDGRMTASRIYKWFKKDFENSNTSVLAHLSSYADADLRKQLEGRTKIDRYAYDWTLNAP